MKFVLLIPVGSGIRTFLCARFLDLVLEAGEVCVWHGLPENSIAGLKARWGDRVRWEALPDFQEGLAERIFRQAKAHAHVHWKYAEGKENILRRVRASGRWWNRFIGAVAGGVGRCCATQSRIQWLDRLHEKSAVGRADILPFQEFLFRERPDIVFCTQQRAIRAVPGMAAARSLAIPTGTFIYSWDNLPKGRIAVPSDHYLVWSEFMKSEMAEYYPDVSGERVKVVGTPQFEHYSNTSLLQPREQFFKTWRLDPSRPVVCFSGDDVMTSPFDPVYLGDLAEAMRRVAPAHRPQVLFRRCPVDRTPRYEPVLRKYPEIVRCDPICSPDSGEDWSQVIHSKDDVALLMNVVRHSDAVVNMGSTMAMDFAIYDKPGIYIAYDPPGATGEWRIENTYKLPHFAGVHRLQPVYWARSADDLGEQVLRALQCPREKRAARQAWLRHQVAHPLDRASERFFEALVEIAKAPRR
jgi:hypothetical protein